SGHHVSWLATRDDWTEAGGDVAREGVFVARTVSRASRQRLSPAGQLAVAAKALWNRDAERGMRELLARHRPDIVHVHKVYPQLSVAPLIIAARAGVPVVQTLHDYELMAASHADPRGGRVDRHEALARFRVLNTATFPVRRTLHASAVSTWIAGSRFLAERYAARGIAADVLAHFTELPAGPGIAPADRRQGIVFVGYLGWEKGVGDVLELTRRLNGERVTVIGDGPDADRVRSASDRLGNLRYRGRIDHAEVLTEMGSARLLLAPSHWQEPAGLVALEAMSLGTPVIAYRSGGLAEYVSDAGGGRVVDAGVESLVGAAQELLGSPEQWGRLSRAGAEGVARRHSPAGYLSQLEALYRRTLGGHGTGSPRRVAWQRGRRGRPGPSSR
ncbi:MAG TPA: glycosyltransferase, partial [Solirubrobacteraceae bacterium]|nr:glycosyltransferase [Solirubrobacteraceae bacterium]